MKNFTSIFTTAKSKSSVVDSFLVALLLFLGGTGTVFAQFNTATVNGTIAAAEYGTHTDGSNQQTSGTPITYMTWDATNLYIGVSAANTAEGFVIYFDKDNLTPIDSGTNTNGTNVGNNYDGTNFAGLPFRADIVMYVKGGGSPYREFRTANGSGGWSTATAGFGSFAESGGTVREFSIPWASFPGGAKPAAFNWFSYVTSAGGFVYGQVPTANAGGTIGTTARYERYYNLTNTATGTSTKPMSRDCYVFNSTTDQNSFGSTSVYDFTMNTTGRQIARVAGNWTIAGTLRVNAGSVFYGSGGSYGNSTVAAGVVSGGLLDMDANNQTQAFTNTLSVSGGTFNMGNASNSVTVASGITTAATAFAITGGAVTASNGTLSIGATNGGNQALAISGGALTLSGSAIINLNGNYAQTGTSTFTQTGGTLIIDGNSGTSTGTPGTAGTSTASGTHLFSVTSSTGASLACSAGTIRIVDPPFSTYATATTRSVNLSYGTTAPTAYQFSGTHIFEFGNGSSSTTGCVDGFVIESFTGTYIVPLNNVTVNAGNTNTGRWVSSGYSGSTFATAIQGSLTINANGEFRNTISAEPLFIKGDIANAGTFTSTQTVTLSSVAFNSTTAGTVNTAAQTISGAGTFRNLTASPTASFTNLTVNNSNTTGVTLSNSYSVSGALTLTSGRVLIGANDLTLIAGATLSATTPSATNMIIINGAGLFKRNIPSGIGTYLFPIGDNTGTVQYSPVTLQFTANSIARIVGAKVIDATSSNINTGSTPVNYLSRYWTFSESGAGGTYNYYINPAVAITGAEDEVGTAASIKAAYWNGSAWTLSTNTYTAGSLVSNATGVSQTAAPLGTVEWTGRDTPPVTYTWVGFTDTSWNTATNWSPSGIPGSSDIVTLANGSTGALANLNLTTAVTVTDITFNGTGSFFTVGSTGSLTVTGNVTYTAGTGAWNAASTFVISSASSQTIPPFTYGNLNGTGGARIWSTGTTSIAGTFTTGAGTYTATNGSTVDYIGAGSQTIGSVKYFNLSNSGNGARTLITGTIDVANTYTPTTAATTPGTVNVFNFSSASSQTIPASSYASITNTGNGARTLAGSGTITIAGTAFTPGTGTYTVTGSTVALTNTTGFALTLPTVASGNSFNILTINGAGGVYTLPATASTQNLATTLNVTAGTLVTNPITNSTILNTVAVGTININGGTLDDRAVLTGLSTTLRVSTAWNHTSGTVTNTSTNGIDRIVFTGGGATTFNGLTASANFTFWNLQISNNTTLTLNTALTVNGIAGAVLTVDLGSTLVAGIFVISDGATTAAGNGFIINGTLKTANLTGFSGLATTTINTVTNTPPLLTLGASSTIEYNGAAAQAGTARTDYANLTINNTAGVTMTASANTTVAGLLTLTAGTLNNGSGTTHALTLNGAITTTSGSITGGGSAAASVSDLVVASTGTITGTLTLLGNFGNITWSRTTGGTVATSGTVNVDGNWSNSAGSLLDLSTTSSAIVLNAAATQTFSGNTTFYNLSLSASGNKDFVATTTTIAGTFTSTAGTMITSGANTFVFSGSAGSIAGTSGKNFVNLTISGSGVTTTATCGTINIKGSFVNSGVFTANPATIVNFNAGAAQTISGAGTTSFGIFTVGSSSTVNSGSHGFSVTGTSFDVATGSTFNGQTNTVTFTNTGGANSAVIGGAGTYNFNGVTISSSSTLTNATNNRNISVSGGWSNSGIYTAGTETITFNGTSPQTVGGSSATTFNSVTVSGTAGGLSLGNSQTINGTLTLSASSGGNIDLNGSNNITLGASAVLTGETCSRQFTNTGSPTQGNGYVQTTRTFASATNYLGITITSATAMGSTNIKRFVQKAVSSVGAANSIKRIYSITPTTAATGNVTLVSSYCDGELNSNTESAPTLTTYYSTGTNETTGANYASFYANASNDASANTVTTTGTGSLIAGQNNITLANPGPSAYFTVQNGDWNTGATWALGSVPPASVATTIKHLVTINAAVTNAPTSITIDPSQSITFGGSGTITTTTITNSGTIDMTSGGTLTIATGGTIVNGSATFTGGTGTVINSGTATLTGTTISFNNLTLNGTLTNSATTTNIKSTLRLNQGSSISGNAVVYDSGATSTVSYSGTSIQTATALDFPASSGPTNVVVNNSGGFRLPFSRTVSGNFTVTSGDVQNLSGTGVTLTMTGTAANLVVNGSITGTNVGSGNDINLVYNVAGILSVSGSGSLSRFLNATVGSSSTLAISRNFEVMFGTFTVDGTLRIDAGGAVSSVVNAVAPIYGASSSLVYNSATTYNRFFEWSASGAGTIGTTAGYPNNVTVQNGSTLNLSNSDNTDRALNGNLSLGSGTTSNGSLNMEAMSGKLTVAGNVLIGGNSASGTSTLTLSTNGASAAIEVSGNWTRTSTGVFTDNGRGTFFQSSGTSTITTNTTEQFTYLRVNKTSGGTVSLANDIQVTTDLTLNAQLVTNAFKVIIPTSNGVTANANGWIRGNLQKNIPTGTNSRTFEVGDTTVYAPVTTAYTGVTSAGNIIVSTTVNDHSQIATSALDASKSVNRFYTITNSGVAGGSYDPTFTFVAGDLDSGTLTSSLGISNYVNPTWTPLTIGTRTSTSTQATGVTLYGDFQLGEGRTVWTAGASTSAWLTSGNWSGGVPTSTSNAYINTASFYPEITSDVAINRLTISSGTSVTVKSTFDLTVTDAIVNNGTLTIENNANLLQTNNVANTGSGSTIVNRNSSALKRFDYTLWSSPVTGSQTLLNFSPLTNTARFYTYKTIGAGAPADPPNIYVAVASPSTTTFATAKGYLIRMPYDHPTAATIWNGSFSGTLPNNGDISYTMDNGIAGQRFNLVGNPYPSPISMTQFVSDNSSNITGTLYFWRETNNSTVNNAYCSWAGGTFTSNGEAQVVNPSGIIRTGQGFFVEVKPSNPSDILNFKNGQRSSDNADQFFKNNSIAHSPTTVETNRFWLNLTNIAGAFSQMAAGYMTDATDGVDLFDGKNINTGSVLLNSILNNEDYTIQGKSLPFNTADVIPLIYKVTDAGDHTITIDHVDGLFTDVSQPIYLKDNLTTTIHDLNTGAYTFASVAGTFNDRFEIIFALPLGIDDPTFTANNVIVYNQNKEFVVNSGNIIMSSIKVFDIRGRLLQERKGINANQTTINGGLANEVLLVQITSVDGITVTKKVIR